MPLHVEVAGDRPAMKLGEKIENPMEYLAIELYRKSELLLPESGRPWVALSEHEHSFYRLLVDHLLAFPDVVRDALDYACDHDKTST